ncbi:unnamed protein product [Adineta steineri]|uniref:Uncharacterized protein n=1 Tax=Adineta steineri TaxID=433720 RepID=A0A820F216_9BILA|nr:unnamed protein product [Adineta steineri]CAF4255413.1 unnamed protein product [Adineta steineri]
MNKVYKNIIKSVEKNDQEPEQSIEIQLSESILLPMIPLPTTTSSKSLPLQLPSVVSASYAESTRITHVLSQPSSNKTQLSSTLSSVTDSRNT